MLAGQLECDVDDHVLLAADNLSSAELEEDLGLRDVVAFGGPLGVQQE